MLCCNMAASSPPGQRPVGSIAIGLDVWAGRAAMPTSFGLDFRHGDDTVTIFSEALCHEPLILLA
jgi:hypothetical protein